MKNSMTRLQKKERGLRDSLVMWHCWATSLMQNLPSMKKKPRRKGRRVPVQEEWCLGCSIDTWREVRSSIMQYMETSWDTRHRLCRDICSHWKWSHMACIIMCANERRPCTSSEDTHGITHAWGAWWRTEPFLQGWRWKSIEYDKLIDGCEKNFCKRGSWYPMILDGYIEY